MKHFIVAVAAAFCLVGLWGDVPSFAADLGYGEGPSRCFLMRRSPILDLATSDEMYSEVEQRYNHALDVSLEPGTVGSQSPRYDWAIEAKIACGKAIGYFRGREVNEDMISKCDCYYGRMTTYIYR